MSENNDLKIHPDIAFQILISMRDMLLLAEKNGKVTYQHAFEILHDLSPQIYSEIIKSVQHKNLNDTAKLFEEQAKIKSLGLEKEITALDLANEAISEIENVIESGQAQLLNEEELKHTRQRLLHLLATKESLMPERRITEHRILERDFSKANRVDFGAQFMQSDDNTVDYKLSNKSYLRIRMLHPDRVEHISGADLIYEQHNEERDEIRVMFLQYKIWEDGVLYLNSGKVETQLLKMKSLLCDKGFCQGKELPENSVVPLDYRFPYCCAFLRPTDRIQLKNEKLISSGIHVPVCAALIMKKIDGKIDKKYSRYQTLTQEIFEHLFNRSFIGSRWMKAKELEGFYKSNNLISKTDSVLLYAREIQNSNPY
jgi:6-pyruvoyl-tetrahydropterin synthase